MKLIKTTGRNAKDAYALLATLERRGAVKTAEVEPTVRKIMQEVQKKGDKALLKFAEKFDSLQGHLRVTAGEMLDAWNATPEPLQQAMQIAAENIRSFAEQQKPDEWTTENTPGVTVGQIIRPLESVGCYVPGGRYPLPSTLLMTTIPAKVAGVERIVVCSPKPARETLAAAHLAGVTEMYRTGGAQAIAAMAYGTETIARVAKIVGPGNLYVTAAKIIASTECGIDMPAGPTEIVVTSQVGDAAGIAADLVAQAEHDPETLAVLVTADSQLAKQVVNEVKEQAKNNKLAQVSIKARGTIFLCGSVEEARFITNRLAPEHLTVDSVEDLAWVKNAGSVFIGNYSPQSMGDYISGPNHVLPTGRVGRMRGGLSIYDFLKVITVQNYTAAGLAKLGPHAIALAEAEGLTAHAQSVRVRMKAGKR
ncbi:histidinol dehydrogenase [Terriglobus roseus DSM 18391]|uniref:Histidinol dehydrogenase n=1 Tax=Terriglobus roseus (strain DSM 18391 / NRRL B-41598 / KBS 63) TaxID=926566 RepID=I3ZKR7_TERRK|nr:histidinol dehydrogenase [Terriglobus roseus]AFL89835.1 histidinol dehydrogenase [Terriglobus roseus DSM 18391]